MAALPEHLQAVLELARWAPSGDNTQPWRFEVLGDEHLLVHGFDTRDHVVYDLDGHASQLALGALLETLRIAASTRGRRALVSRRPDTPDTHLLFDVRFEPAADPAPDPLAECITQRVVQRRAMSMRALSAQQKAELAHSLPAGYEVRWFEPLALRWRLARFMFANAKLRLIIPEGHAVHSQAIEWGARFSEDRVPEQAVGVDPLTARLMRWAMASWGRLHFMNTWLFAHLPPRLLMDLLPGVRCAAHCALLAPAPPMSIDDYLAAGSALQRFWLSATRLGLLMQPEMTPVIFARYHREGRRFSVLGKAAAMAAAISRRLDSLLGRHEPERLFFMGRIGSCPVPRSRSMRKPLAKLLAPLPPGTSATDH